MVGGQLDASKSIVRAYCSDYSLHVVQYSSAYNAIEFETLYAILILTAYKLRNTSKSKRNARSAPALFILVSTIKQVLL